MCVIADGVILYMLCGKVSNLQAVFHSLIAPLPTWQSNITPVLGVVRA
jgi:hypothetical protein